MNSEARLTQMEADMRIQRWMQEAQQWRLAQLAQASDGAEANRLRQAFGATLSRFADSARRAWSAIRPHDTRAPKPQAQCC